MAAATMDRAWAESILRDPGTIPLATAALLGCGSVIELEQEAQAIGIEIDRPTHQSNPVIRLDDLTLLVGSKASVVRSHKTKWVPASNCAKALGIPHDEVALELAIRRGVVVDSESGNVDQHTLESLARLLREEASREVEDGDWLIISGLLAAVREASGPYDWVEPIEPPPPPPPPVDPCAYEPQREIRTSRIKYATAEELDGEAIERCKLLGIRTRKPCKERPIDSRGRFIASGYDALRMVGYVERSQHWRVRQARENLMISAYRATFPDSESR